MGFITNKLNKHNWGGGHIVPFGNQTQRAGKSTIHEGFSQLCEPPFK